MAELIGGSKGGDLIGKRFGKLVVLCICDQRQSGHIVAHCICDCGNEKDVMISSLRNGRTKSCGCFRREYVIGKNTTHGMSNTRIYSIWCDMHKRCEKPSNKRYENYGGRGITVCSDWQTFQPFYDWAIHNGYNPALSIDRIDVNEGYSPNNCRWATSEMQQNNTTRNKVIEFMGRSMTQAQWARETGISQSAIKDRLTKLNWSVEKTLTTPIKERRNGT